MIRGPLRGRINVPGDKSITHRAIILAAVADGESRLVGYLKSEDCLRTVKAFSMMGIAMEEEEGARPVLRVQGRNFFGLVEPSDILDCGNSGTTLRLLTGLLAGQSFFSMVTGDASLRRRPMDRVVTPLRQMGADILGRAGATRAPLAITGKKLSAIEHTLRVPSAQVKSAILLAGLFADGKTVLTDPFGSRDHTERLLLTFGARFEQTGNICSVIGQSSFSGMTLEIPGDISSAAFLIVAALLVPHSEITLCNVGVNLTRTGILTVLQKMGAQIDVKPIEKAFNEPVADITVRASRLNGIVVNETLLPALIDEIPILCIAAAAAEGETVIRGAEELRLKESDRIAVMVRALSAMGVPAHELPDGIRIRGTKRWVEGRCFTEGDHRVAMAMKVASLRLKGEIALDDTSCIQTSFPSFEAILDTLQTGESDRESF